MNVLASATRTCRSSGADQAVVLLRRPRRAAVAASGARSWSTRTCLTEEARRTGDASHLAAR